MTTLSGPVGIRNGLTQVANAPVDQEKIIKLLWGLSPANGGMRGLQPIPTHGSAFKCPPALASAIKGFQAFWVLRGELPIADSVVDPRGRTLGKLDALADGRAPSPPPVPSNTELQVLRFRQVLTDTSEESSVPAIIPVSAMPFLFSPSPKGARLIQGRATGTVRKFRFRIEKNGAIFWVGACVPAGVTDFSRAYVFFHPDTISSTDDANYAAFGGRWPEVERYVRMYGLQMAASMKTVPLIVPFMTASSHANSASTNLFADRGVETIDDILLAIRLSLGEANVRRSVQRIGVASFSSGVDHLFRFAQKVGASGIIREQIDFDSAYMISAHKRAPALSGAVNWMVTQTPPPMAGQPGWLHLPLSAFGNVTANGNSTHPNIVHGNIGFMMFQTMMTLSLIV